MTNSEITIDEVLKKQADNYSNADIDLIKRAYD